MAPSENEFDTSDLWYNIPNVYMYLCFYVSTYAEKGCPSTYGVGQKVHLVFSIKQKIHFSSSPITLLIRIL